MIEIRLGDRYAKSIYGLAVEKGEIEGVLKDFQRIEEVCESNPDFVEMLKSPLIWPDRKQKIITAIFGSDFNKITKVFIEIVIRKKREQWLRDIALRFLALYDRKNNITRGVLLSATALSPDHRERIKKVVEEDLKTSFVIEEKIDPEVIGGFSLKVDDYLYDGTISTALRKLKQEFDKNPYIKLS